MVIFVSKFRDSKVEVLEIRRLTLRSPWNSESHISKTSKFGDLKLIFRFQISCPESQRYQNWNATNQKLWLKKSKKTREDPPLILHLMVKLIDYPDDDVILRWRHDDVTLTFLCIITSQSNHMLTNLKYWDQLIYTIKHKTVKKEPLFKITVLFTEHAIRSEYDFQSSIWDHFCWQKSWSTSIIGGRK